MIFPRKSLYCMLDPIHYTENTNIAFWNHSYDRTNESYKNQIK